MQGLGLRALIRNVAGTFGRQLAAGVAGVATAAVISRAYGANQYGEYVMALLLPTALATFLNLGLAAANCYFLASQQATPRSVLRGTLHIFAAVGMAGLTAGAALLHWWGSRFFPGVDLNLLWIGLLLYPLTLLVTFLTSIFQGLQRFREYNLPLVMQPLIVLTLTTALALADSSDVALLLFAHVISGLIALSICLRQVRVILGCQPGETSKPYVTSALSYGVKAHLSNILAYVNYRADLFLVNFFTGPSQTGLYAVSTQLAEGLWLLSSAVSTALLPRLSHLHDDEGKRRELTPLISRWVATITFAGAVLLAAVAFPAVTTVFGSAYSGAVPPLIILLPGIVAGSASRVISNDIAARGRPEINTLLALPVVGVNIIGNVALIPALGLNGAAVASTLAYTLSLGLKLRVYQKLTGNPWHASIVLRASDIREVLRVVVGRKLKN